MALWSLQRHMSPGKVTHSAHCFPVQASVAQSDGDATFYKLTLRYFNSGINLTVEDVGVPVRG